MRGKGQQASVYRTPAAGLPAWRPCRSGSEPSAQTTQTRVGAQNAFPFGSFISLLSKFVSLPKVRQRNWQIVTRLLFNTSDWPVGFRRCRLGYVMLRRLPGILHLPLSKSARYTNQSERRGRRTLRHSIYPTRISAGESPLFVVAI